MVSLTDAEQFIDDTIPVTGTYFYAVMTKQLEDREHTVFIPGERILPKGCSSISNTRWSSEHFRHAGKRRYPGKMGSVASGIEYEVDGYAVSRQYPHQQL